MESGIRNTIIEDESTLKCYPNNTISPENDDSKESEKWSTQSNSPNLRHRKPVNYKENEPGPPKRKLDKPRIRKPRIRKPQIRKRYLLCPECEYKIDKRDRMFRHIEREHSNLQDWKNKGISFKIEIVNKLEQQVDHLQKVSELKTVQNSSIEKKHKRVPEQCQDCGKIYCSRYNLKRHIHSVHTKEKPLKCTECTYTAVEKYKLNYHMNNHHSKNQKHQLACTNEKLYQCDLCKSNFNEINAFNDHMLSFCLENIKNNVCSICLAILDNAKDLIRHLLDKHDVNLQKTFKSTEKQLNNYIKQLKVKSEYDTYLNMNVKKESSPPAGDIPNLTCKMCNTFQKQDIFSQNTKQPYMQDLSKYICNNCSYMSTNDQNLIDFKKSEIEVKDYLPKVDDFNKSEILPTNNLPKTESENVDNKVLVHSTVVIKLEIESEPELSEYEEPCYGF